MRRFLLRQMPAAFTQFRAASTSSTLKDITSACACPCAPCGCNCLPPPCNTPAKCLQYMTGYYYYPYGTWFCGPYHIPTSPCGPCAGPVRADGCGGPAPPCPGGPCGPPCVGPGRPCGPCVCGPCGPCGACGPLSCCGFCGVGNSFQNYAVGNPYDCYSPFNSLGTGGPYAHMYPNQHMPQNFTMPYNTYPPHPQYGQYNWPPSHFGPCYDVPMQMPIPVDGSFPHNPYTPTPDNFPRAPYTPTPPPTPTTGPGRPYTFSKPTLKDIPTIENVRSGPSINGPCPKNLSPQSLRMSPLSRYESTLRMGASNRSPKTMGRALPEVNPTLVSHYSTRSMQKLPKDNNLELSNAFRRRDIIMKDELKDDKKCKGSCKKPFWNLF